MDTGSLHLDAHGLRALWDDGTLTLTDREQQAARELGDDIRYLWTVLQPVLSSISGAVLASATEQRRKENIAIARGAVERLGLNERHGELT